MYICTRHAGEEWHSMQVTYNELVHYGFPSRAVWVYVIMICYYLERREEEEKEEEAKKAQSK